MIADLLTEADEKMSRVVENTAGEFGTVRTGRANPGLLHRVMVDYYGTPTPLQQIAGLSVPEGRMLIVTPYDKSALGDIERAIFQADLGLNPANDGNIIRLVFPPLTEERRKELIRVVRQLAEEGRVSIRNVRRQIKDDFRALGGDVSEDDVHKGDQDLQDLTRRHVEHIDELLSRKETELLEV